MCVEVEPGRQVAGVAAGNGCWCAPGSGGLLWRTMVEVDMAWVI